MSTVVDVPVPAPSTEPAPEPVPEITTETTEQVEEVTAMSEHTYKYEVNMHCGGCSGAVTRVLEKAKRDGAGVNDFTVSLETKEVIVHGSIPFDDLTARIAKTGKEITKKEIVV